MRPISAKPKQAIDEKELLEIFGRLSKQDRKSLVDFAHFLATRSAESAPEKIPEPKITPRPKEESVVKAIKRLSADYHMLDKAPILNEASVLMTQHIMHGRAADEVIDELERLFEQQYRKLLRTDE